MTGVNRIKCPECGTDCLEAEITCWKCRSPLKPVVQPADRQPVAPSKGTATKSLINFDDGTAYMEGEDLCRVANEPGSMPAVALPPLVTDSPAKPASVHVSTSSEVMRLTFCKDCGYQNSEGTIECAKCGKQLEVVAAGTLGDIKAIPRNYKFDLLGIVWIILGFTAMYCGRFLVKADTEHPGVTISDYLWTGVVACAPGVFIFLRHYICKTIFWSMTIALLLIWPVIAAVWLLGALQITDNGQIGLYWLGALTALTLFSYITVRQNDDFDKGD